MVDIVFTHEEHLGLVTLNRSQALNALTLDMIKAMQQQLLAWEKEADIHAVIVQGEGEKAFCAGGDVRWLYEAGLNKDPEQMQFFWHEYRLNHYIHHFKKPYISLMNGITMGGGVGISLHGSHPIATENFVFAMPETGIGFFPDIGASYLLARCPDATGIYLGLTGKRLKAQEAYELGLIKQIIPANKMQEFINRLASIDLSKNAHQQVNACLKEFSMEHEKASITEHLVTINRCFSQQTIEDIFSALEEEGNEWAITILNNLKQKAPLSLKVTLAQIHKAKAKSLAECLAIDYCVVNQFMHGHDFYEGVRALLVDKDKSPHWQPSSLDEVTPALVADFFECREQLIFIAG
ncbi:enoyl-CoA hydratase/isomerase family protein [Legionella clemsonensis]|uniref:3-hydroxyisobutyryl-CoA hydrolase n=1 Tax=Legionella clemsonensis TaxID=1867846 RepID=A0A222P373_9GAMM|nr:enoyl-CoA hydratase/isomerase family protein [Legionella clemsonensis]ASQ46308.1 putative enoyl-CoA hydratase echA8 [Legionella clemsonensis]